LTFAPGELMATKIRALYQRKKGRDIFDLWLALHEMGLDPDSILAAFPPYRPEGFTPQLAIENLQEKLADETFLTDLEPLVAELPYGFDMRDAGAEIIDLLLRRL
jgi:Nucleotidyl transferase AbiEii toxin, Type IV TA system